MTHPAATLERPRPSDAVGQLAAELQSGGVAGALLDFPPRGVERGEVVGRRTGGRGQRADASKAVLLEGLGCAGEARGVEEASQDAEAVGGEEPLVPFVVPDQEYASC